MHTRRARPDDRRSQRLDAPRRRTIGGRSPRSTAAASDDVSALLQARDLPTLIDTIVRTVQRECAASEVALQLADAAPEDRSAATRTRGQRSAPDAAPLQRLVVPLRDGPRRLGTLRLHAPQRTRLPWLRRYLEHASAMLAHHARWREQERRAQRYDALLAHQSDWCVLVVSPTGVVHAIDGNAHEMAPHQDSWLGQPLEGTPGSTGPLGLSRARVRALLSSARRNGRTEVETRLDADSEIQVTLVPLGSNGEMLCVLRDLTKVRAMEKALLRRNHELSEAAERLKEVDTLKNEFLSNVSHELRTPLTAIIAYAEAMLLTRPPEATRDQFLRVINEQGQKLQKLIAGLLDIAKLDSLATELKLQLGSINQVIEAAAVTVRPTADKSQIGFDLQLEPDLPLVYVDELRSQQIVWNLLTNAIKFSPAGSTIHVRSWSEAGYVWVAVRDEGIGIAPEHHELIFQKFVQVDGSSTRRHGGVGLGLDLVQHLVALHGGRVQVESALGHGATFSFCIPIEKRLHPRGARPRREGAGHPS